MQYSSAVRGEKKWLENRVFMNLHFGSVALTLGLSLGITSVNAQIFQECSPLISKNFPKLVVSNALGLPTKPADKLDDGDIAATLAAIKINEKTPQLLKRITGSTSKQITIGAIQNNAQLKAKLEGPYTNFFKFNEDKVGGATGKLDFKPLKDKGWNPSGSVTPGEPTTPGNGGIPLPGSGPIVFNPKNKCFQEAPKGAPTAIAIEDYATTTIKWQQNGFREVGRITVRGPGDNHLTEAGRQCAFVMISAGTAVTALHCVAISATAKPMLLDNLRFELCFLNVSDPKTASNKPCEWREIGLDAVPIWPADTEWSEAKGPPSNDIALLSFSIKESSPSEIQYADIAGSPSSIDTKFKTTSAGFGLSSMSESFPQKYVPVRGMSVAWREGGKASPSHFFWKAPDEGQEGTIPGASCRGDSGGPLYRGHIYGRTNPDGSVAPSEAKKVIGLLSYTIPAAVDVGNSAPSLAACQRGTSGFLLLAPYSPWICEKSKVC
jgi:Trypsin